MSTIPTRRVLTRHTTARNPIAKDNENANVTRHIRASSRPKVFGIADTTDGASATTADSKASAMASVVTRRMGTLPGNDAKLNSNKNSSGAVQKQPVGKRKREALVEVTAVNNNKNRKSKDEEKGVDKGKNKQDAAVGTRAVKVSVGTKVKEEVLPPAAKVFSKPTRESLRAISRPTGHRSTRSTSVSTTASITTAGSGQVTASKQKNFSVLEPSRPPVFTRKPSLRKAESDLVDKAVEGEEDNVRASKRQHTETEIASPRPTLIHDINDESQAEADKIAAELVQVVDHEVVVVYEDPKGEQLWDDLDAEDWDDPAMVSEYVVDVCTYLKVIEIEMLPNPDYMTNHPELDWEKRGILVDWIIQVHARFNLLQETLFLFSNILDRFLSCRPVSLSKLQLVGITAFFIASKYEETYAPSITDIAYLADGQYTVEEILKAERYILKILDWNLRYPGPMGWLRRGSKADNCEFKARMVGKYLIEIGCLEWRLIATLPSLLAAAAMWLARLVLGREVWTPNMEHYMTYSEAELLPTANIMLNYILEPIRHESLYKKYAHKRYLKCSAFMRYWALERWPESTIVLLERDLPALKEDIRLERESKKDTDIEI